MIQIQILVVMVVCVMVAHGQVGDPPVIVSIEEEPHYVDDHDGSCVDTFGSKGVCLPSCLCLSFHVERGDCPVQQVCCTQRPCQRGLGEACLNKDGYPGTCTPSCYADPYAKQTECKDGLLCCVEKKNGGSCPGDKPKVSKVCESKLGDGMCHTECGFGTYDGGETTYCSAHEVCCVIDYRPGVGRTCRRLDYEIGKCTDAKYCKDSHSLTSGKRSSCFREMSCCSGLPGDGEVCDLGYGKEGVCAHTSYRCSHEGVLSCATGYKCC